MISYHIIGDEEQLLVKRRSNNSRGLKETTGLHITYAWVLTLAPASMRARAIAECPRWQAIISTVKPSCRQGGQER
jgi:hypothetical protein